MAKRHSCEGEPSLTNYGRGCRCDLCKSVKSTYERERRERANKYRGEPSKKKPSGKRDNPLVFSDAYSMVDIIRANPHLDWTDKQRRQAGV